MRLVLALTVCLAHASELSGFQQFAITNQLLSSTVAVQAFFVISGFLIFMSYERSSSLKSYALKRFWRIYPAYFVVILLCAFGMVFVSKLPLNEYFSLTWLKYVTSNLLFINFAQSWLPGVFEMNKIPAVNGALWTLKVEVMFYMLVPCFVYLFRRFSRMPVMLFFYAVSVIYAMYMTHLAEKNGVGFYFELARQIPGQLSYFISGAFLYYYYPIFERNIRYFLLVAVLVLSVNNFYALPFFQPFAIAILVVFFGTFLYAGNFGKYGDFSYGAYIIHFPLIQLLLNSGRFIDSPWLFFLTLLSLVILGSVLMWHFVEKRLLYNNSHYLSKNVTPEINKHLPVV